MLTSHSRTHAPIRFILIANVNRCLALIPFNVLNDLLLHLFYTSVLGIA
jgi:hypothetical protein